LPKGSKYQVVFSDITRETPTFLINCSISYEGEGHRLGCEPILLPCEKNLRIKNIFSSLSSHSPSSPEIKSAVWSLIALWSDSDKTENSPAAKAPSYLKKAKEHIEQNATKDVSIADLSKEFGVSPSYFRKEFKRYFALSPKEYSLQCRLDAACNYLETGELNVSEVSRILSFSCPAYFSRLFKEKKGVSPLEFMKKSRN
jgi:AraC-like DNA-binding protein